MKSKFPPAIPAVFALSLALVACSDAGTNPEPAASTSPTTTAEPDAMESSAPATVDAAPLTPEAEKGETGARNVLLTWARALENGQYSKAWAQFGDAGAKSGMSDSAYAEQFAECSRMTVAVASGTMEGAAGSSYYTAPTTLTCEFKAGSSKVMKGDVVLRRVNDVPGATAEQLHWHLESADLN